MNVRWSFFAFDWIRFRALEPPLRRAMETGDFSAQELTEAAEILERMDEDAPPEEVGGALIVEICGRGERVVFEAGLPELLRQLRRQPEGEAVAETLGVLISAAPNVQDWFAADGGPAGLLSEEQTRELAAAFAAFRRHYRPPEPPRGLSALARRFTATEPAHELLDDLMRLVEEAAARRQGIAILREE
jgi:hypothetical protein